MGHRKEPSEEVSAGPASVPPAGLAGASLRYSTADIGIDGSYQHRALREGNAIQRFWHYGKQLTIDRYLPPKPGERVLDVGCGSGVISDFLASRGAHVTGIDGDEASIAFARRTFSRENLSFEVGLVDKEFPAQGQINTIYCLEVIEHLYRAQGEALLHAFHSCLAPGGRLYLTTPNYRSAWPVIERLMDTFKLAPQMAGHQHVTRFSPKSLAKTCEAAGFAVEALETTSLLAPWVAPLSWGLALKVNALETGARFDLGSILVCVARKGR
jgi:2-polyprenyl-3-methyl-5-hydroxy-6-metoxy-1,4-benzoquinol methylase